MIEKQETLLETINKLKSDVDKGKEKSAQQKAQIRDLQQVWIVIVLSRSHLNFVNFLLFSFVCFFVKYCHSLLLI